MEPIKIVNKYCNSISESFGISKQRQNEIRRLTLSLRFECTDIASNISELSKILNNEAELAIGCLFIEWSKNNVGKLLCLCEAEFPELLNKLIKHIEENSDLVITRKSNIQQVEPWKN